MRGEVCRSGSGGGVDPGDEERDDSSLMDEGEPGVDMVSEGVSMSKSGLSLDAVSADFEFFARFGIDCEPSEDADDSSNVLFGER